MFYILLQAFIRFKEKKSLTPHTIPKAPPAAFFFFINLYRAITHKEGWSAILWLARHAYLKKGLLLFAVWPSFLPELLNGLSIGQHTHWKKSVSQKLIWERDRREKALRMVHGDQLVMPLCAWVQKERENILLVSRKSPQKRAHEKEKFRVLHVWYYTLLLSLCR